MNCAAIPGELLESELFGHRKDSFTGAISDRKGKLIETDGGTLFLDEIGDMRLQLQAKLLRVLEDSTNVRQLRNTIEKMVIFCHSKEINHDGVIKALEMES